MKHSNPDPEIIFSSFEIQKFIKSCKNAIEGLRANPTDKRKLLLMQFSLRVLYNTSASIQLTTANHNGAVACLMRPTFELLCRGLWLNLCATDYQIDYFLNKDRLTKKKQLGDIGKVRDMNLGELAKEVDNRMGQNGLPIKLFDIFEDNKKVFNSLTHGGLILLNNTFDGKYVTNSFSKNDILLQCYFQLLMAASATTSLLSAFENYDEAEKIIHEFNPIHDTLRETIELQESFTPD
ncbi:hypothetical protein Q4602_02145 [Paraglaciecola chathamensis]|uniref:DUF6988 family protein n=1 Tax=Paraglaciecola chathamensis TaxID=368405 RepID=UPI00270CED55|nr:hypothetical protein [Paraglaciecola chathamensis]MDO6838258.1 hypothetical protein [Paraglaciecola chathamensis]